MSENTPEDSDTSAVGVGDDQLPEDLVPSDDNPLAKGLEPGETAGDLFEDGKPAEQDADDESTDTEADTEADTKADTDDQAGSSES